MPKTEGMNKYVVFEQMPKACLLYTSQQTATLEVCTEKLKQASRNYAKRQLTWFRHMDGVTWLDAGAAAVSYTHLISPRTPT